MAAFAPISGGTEYRRSACLGARILTESQDRLGSWWGQGAIIRKREAQNSSSPPSTVRALLPRWHQPAGLRAQPLLFERLGRFMSADPYMARGGPRNRESWNRYAYTSGDPSTEMTQEDYRSARDRVGGRKEGGTANRTKFLRLRGAVRKIVVPYASTALAGA